MQGAHYIQFVQVKTIAPMIWEEMAPLNWCTVGSSMMLVGSASQSRKVLGKKALSVAVGTGAESHEIH